MACDIFLALRKNLGATTPRKKDPEKRKVAVLEGESGGGIMSYDFTSAEEVGKYELQQLGGQWLRGFFGCS